MSTQFLRIWFRLSVFIAVVVIFAAIAFSLSLNDLERSVERDLARSGAASSEHGCIPMTTVFWEQYVGPVGPPGDSNESPFSFDDLAQHARAAGEFEPPVGVILATEDPNFQLRMRCSTIGRLQSILALAAAITVAFSILLLTGFWTVSGLIEKK